jgi:hypothetical protein
VAKVKAGANAPQSAVRSRRGDDDGRTYAVGVSNDVSLERSSGMLDGPSAGVSIGALVAVAVALYIVLVVRRRK